MSKTRSLGTGLRRGPWMPEEDEKLVSYIQKHGPGNWRALPKLAGLNRCGKSCRLRWSNYLRPDLKREKFSLEEEQKILGLRSVLGNRWSKIASCLPGRTDNEIKNFWNTHLRKKLFQKKLFQKGIDPMTHLPLQQGRTDNNEMKNIISLVETKESLPLQGEAQGNSTNFESIKVAKGVTPSFQGTEETTPNSEIEGSQSSSSFHPSSAQASVNECAESGRVYFWDTLDLPDSFFSFLENNQEFGHQPDTLGNISKKGHEKMWELSTNSAQSSSSFHCNSAQASAFEDAESDSGLSWVSSTSMLSPNWVSEYEDYFPDWVDRGDSNCLGSLLEVRHQEVASQPFHPSLSSTQLDTLGNIPQQGHEKLGELSSNNFGEQKEFVTHLSVRGELQESEDDSSHLSLSAHNLTSRSHEQEVAHDDLHSSLQPFHEHSEKLLPSNNIGESKEFGSHLSIQGEFQGTASTQAVNVTSESIMDYTNEFTRSEGMPSTQSIDVASESLMDYTNEFTRSEAFESKEALIQWTREVGRKHGFVIVIKRSDSGDGGQKARITFCCERGGQYRNTGKNKVNKKKKQSRNVGTKKCGCPFTLKGQKLDSDGNWKLKVVCGGHNHPTTEPLKGYSYAGRLSKEETSLLTDMSKSMECPKDILVRLKSRDVNNASTIKHIYNARQRYKVIEMAKRSKMQQLLSTLSKYKYIEWHQSSDNTDIVKDLFWAHPVSIDLLHAFPCVLLMDCTHKTNRYNLPLLEIVGVTSTKMKFSVAFAYLESDQEDNYMWALERLSSIMDDNVPTIILTDKELALMTAIKRVFPTAKHLLCRRHISKNIWTSCKNFFATNEMWEKFRMSWKLVVLSSNEDEFTKHLSTLKQEFSSYPQVIEYVTNTWLNYYKERFVSAWTDNIMHFGNLKKEGVERLHSRLKKLLRCNQNNFETYWAEIHKLLEQQHKDVKASFKKSLRLMDNQFKHHELKELRGFISIDALQMVLSELGRAATVDVSKCGCIIRRTHGLPCAHEIAEFKIESRPIPLESVDLYWRKLELVPVTKKQEAKLVHEPVSNLIAKCFDETHDDTKSMGLKKLTETDNSQSASLTELEAKEDINGRPDLKGSSMISTAQVKKNRQSKGKVNGNKRLKLNAFVSFFPVGLQPYIHWIKDVVADGNCGFRAIADLMGFGENEWQRVREDLLNELNSHIEHYSLLYENRTNGIEGRVKELIHSLSYFEDCPSHDRWMIMPDMGHLIASAYNVILFHLSSQQCLTFVPLRSIPVPTNSRKDIAIGFVNNNHFVEVFLLPDHPIPPIAFNWYKFHHPCAKGWDSVYISRIEHFKKIIANDVATVEIIIDSNSDD